MCDDTTRIFPIDDARDVSAQALKASERLVCKEFAANFVLLLIFISRLPVYHVPCFAMNSLAQTTQTARLNASLPVASRTSQEKLFN